MRLKFVVAAAALSIGADKPDLLRCNFHRTDACTQSGCRRNSPEFWAEWETGSNVYRRCDKKTCETHIVTISQAANATFLTSAYQVIVARIYPNNYIIEVNTSGWNVFVHRGKCFRPS